jgi:tRNA-2-methylthio-N6-dimethylallyladenosine synthase
MNRGYTREWYLDRIAAINRIIEDCAISTDIITGFCGETDKEHEETMSLMRELEFDFAYMYKYSERPKTLAERKFEDDVSEEVKSKRITEIVDLQREHCLISNKKQVGQIQKVLIEGVSKKSDDFLGGRNLRNSKVIFPKGELKKGTYVMVKITDCTSATLLGEVVEVLKD